MSGFASTTDLAEKTISFDELAPGLYGYTAEGDPNSGVIVGDDSVLVVDAQATPRMAADVIARIRTVTDKPIRHVVLTHYHAVRVLGAAGYEGAEIIASDATRAMIAERGQQDMDSEIGRFPRLFRGKESIPGLTWPHLTFHKRMTLWMGSREVQIIHIGRSHTAGDTVVWLPKERVLFAGDTVEFGATPYCGDAHFADWPGTIDAIRALGAAGPGAGPRPIPAHARPTSPRASTAPPPSPATSSPSQETRRRRRPGPPSHLPPGDGADAPQIRPLGHLRALHALRRRPRLRRGRRPRPPQDLDRRARHRDVARPGRQAAHADPPRCNQ